MTLKSPSPPSFSEAPHPPSVSRSSREVVLYEGEEVTLHTAADFEKMRAAGRLAAQTLDYVTPHIVEGITTEEINRLCHDFISQRGARPASLHYKGFPKSVCTSLNHVVCHGIPSDQKYLKAGDILNLDVALVLDGWHGDTSRMFKIGKPGVKADKLIAATYEAMMRGIEVIRPGATLGDIGAAIEETAKKHRFSVVRDFCGHGLGQVFHAAPNILNFGKAGKGFVLQEGMFFTVEPMLNAGKAGIKVLSDGWTAVTRDKSLSAQWEHALGVTATGFEIFTLS